MFIKCSSVFVCVEGGACNRDYRNAILFPKILKRTSDNVCTNTILKKVPQIIYEGLMGIPAVA